VATIDTMAANLSKIFPKRKIIIAHWQLSWDQLEKRIIEFKNRNYDILLSTTVIENGIDFPNVNTIIINESYKFGISQIHQLRWRVGRSDRKWYCYLLFNKDKIKDDAANDDIINMPNDEVLKMSNNKQFYWDFTEIRNIIVNIDYIDIISNIELKNLKKIEPLYIKKPNIF